MQQIRKKLTYANVMSSLAVFLVLGGASAFAAVHLGRNSVGANQLKKGAVSATKLGRNAVTTSAVRSAAITADKIQNAAVTATKLGEGSVGNAQTQLVKVFKGPAVPAAQDEASAQRIDIGAVGPFKLYAKCFHFGEFVESVSFVELTSGAATLNRADAKQEPEYLTPSSPAALREIGASFVKGDSFSSSVNSDFQASASDGTQITGTIVNGAKSGAPEGGNGPFLIGDSCLVGPVTIFGG